MDKRIDEIIYRISDIFEDDKVGTELRDYITKQENKSRSITAMLFWEMKRQHRQYYKTDYKNPIDEERAFGAYCIANLNFAKAYKILKDNK